MNAPSENELHAIIGRIYDSVAEPNALNDVVVQLAHQFDAHSAVLFTPALPRESGGLFVLHHYDPATIQRYCDYYFGLDLWWQAGHERAAGGAVVTGAELVARDIFERSEFYNDFLKATDTYHVIATDIRLLTDACQVDVSLAFHGTRRHRGFGAPDKALLEVVVPHLRRALQLSARIGGTLDGLQLAVDALECLADGVLLLSADGRVLHATRAAQAALSAGSGLRLRNGRLCAWLARDNAELAALLGRAAGSEGAASAGTMAVRSPGVEQLLILSVFPLPTRQTLLADANAAARMLVTLRDPSHHPAPRWDVLARHFAITPAELRLCQALADDVTLPEYCARHKLSENTGRSQLKSVFFKTGVRRQSELLRLINAFG